MPFTVDVTMPRVRFGRGSANELGRELERLGIARAIVLSTPEQAGSAERLATSGGDRIAGFHPHATMHTPVFVSEAAADAARAIAADGLVAIGGGSTVNLAKAIALRMRLPIVAIPTSFAGSEMTTILGETEGGEKRTLRDPIVLPRTVLYDPALTETMPLAFAGPSGMNALAHSAEALYSPDANPIVDGWAIESIRALGEGLSAIADGRDGGHDRAFYGAWLAGACLGAAGMGLHHKICHTLGGSFGMPHAETHAVMLPYTIAYNAPDAPEAARKIAEALGAANAPSSLHDLLHRLCPVTSLSGLGMAESDLDRAADIATRNPYPNPRPLDRSAIRAMLQRAWGGETPEAA
jgi:maleylacetate reductase